MCITLIGVLIGMRSVVGKMERERRRRSRTGGGGRGAWRMRTAAPVNAHVAGSLMHAIDFEIGVKGKDARRIGMVLDIIAIGMLYLVYR